MCCTTIRPSHGRSRATTSDQRNHGAVTDERGEPEEELQLGPRTRWQIGALGRFGWRWRAGSAVVVVAAVAIPLIVTSQPRAPSAVPHSTPPPPVGVREPLAPRKPTVHRIPPFLLGVHRSWDLFARGNDSVVRIEFARGRVTTTPVPPLESTGPVSFVVGRRAALVRPLDFVPGFVVPDGMPAQKPPPSLDCGGPAVPGPRPDTIWVPRCSRTSGVSPRLFLTRFDGSRTGVSAPVPGGNSPIEVLPDGQGYLLFLGSVIGTVETFDVRPGRPASTFNRVVAVGPTRWLVQSCNHVGRCHGDAIVDPTNGKSRRLHIQFAGGSEPGVISPDGRAAALPMPAPGAAIVYVDLATGAFHGLLLRPSSTDDQQTMAWSPDSKWLFVLSGDGTLYAVDGRTGLVVEDLTAELHLPPLEQLAIRPAPSS